MNNVINSESVSFKFIHTEDYFLKDIDLTVEKGECVLICGRSGSGKTTFSRLINGVSPNFVEGELTGSCFTLDLKAGEADINDYVPIVGSVFQNPKTQHFAVDTTNEFAFPLENMGIDPDQILNRINEVSRIFNIEHLLERNIFNLSGGEKQQIAFATANMLQPQVLVLDEVTSNLDDVAIQHLSEMIKLMKERGMTILLTEHRLAWTKGIVDRYVLFEDGKIIEEWEAEDFQQLSNEYLNQRGMRSMNLKEHRRLLKEKTQLKEIAAAGSLKTQDLAIGYDKQKPVLRDLNLMFNQGQVTGLLGRNGTGKSTLSHTITGLLKPVSGSILWNDQVISRKELVKKSFLVMQDTNYQLFSDSVEEEVLIGAEHPEYKDEVLEQLSLADVSDRHPMSLSGGQKQRVAIASAILSGKEIIAFDEPTSGLDYHNMERFGRLLSELKAANVVVIVITHDIELAAEWCDHIITLHKNN